MRAIPLPRNRTARWALAIVAYLAIIAAGNAIAGCGATAVDLDGDGVISHEEIALDFEDRYNTFRVFVVLGVALAEREGALDATERGRVDSALAAADTAAGKYAQDLRAGITPGSAASNRRLARSLFTALTNYLAAGEAAAAEDTQ